MKVLLSLLRFFLHFSRFLFLFVVVLPFAAVVFGGGFLGSLVPLNLPFPRVAVKVLPVCVHVFSRLFSFLFEEFFSLSLLIVFPLPSQ